MERAEIEPTPPSRSCAVLPDQILYVVGLVVSGDCDSFTVSPFGGLPGCSLGKKRQFGEASAGVLAVGVIQLGECAGGVLVDPDQPIGKHQVTKATRVGMASQWQPGDCMNGAGLDLPS